MKAEGRRHRTARLEGASGALAPRAAELWRLASGGWRLALLLLLAGVGAAIHAAEAPPAAADAALEERVTAVASELRCLVCQNQTLADSNAPLAVDLRNQIREQMQKGASERAVVDYMVARYGDFVLYRPPFKTTTVLLWTGPVLLVIAGLAVLAIRLTRRRRDPQPELSSEERARAQRLLAGGGNGTSRLPGGDELHPESRPPGAVNQRR